MLERRALHDSLPRPSPQIPSRPSQILPSSPRPTIPLPVSSTVPLSLAAPSREFSTLG